MILSPPRLFSDFIIIACLFIWCVASTFYSIKINQMLLDYRRQEGRFNLQLCQKFIDISCEVYYCWRFTKQHEMITQAALVKGYCLFRPFQMVTIICFKTDLIYLALLELNAITRLMHFVISSSVSSCESNLLSRFRWR